MSVENDPAVDTLLGWTPEKAEAEARRAERLRTRSMALAILLSGQPHVYRERARRFGMRPDVDPQDLALHEVTVEAELEARS